MNDLNVCGVVIMDMVVACVMDRDGNGHEMMDKGVAAQGWIWMWMCGSATIEMEADQV